MRLLINTASTFKGGGVQVALSILSECRHFDDFEFGVVLGPGLSGVVREEDFPENFEFFHLDYRPAQRVFSLRKSEEDLEQIELSFGPDVVFTTSGPSYWRPRAPHLMGFNLPHHVYPDSPYLTQVLTRLERIRWRAKSLLIRHYTRKYADAWVVQTDDVNRRLCEWIGSEQVYTVPNTVSRAYFLARKNSANDGKSRSHGDGFFRLLVLSSYYRHKNLEIINDIVDLMRADGIEDIRFTMTLPAMDFEKTIAPENRAWIDNVGPQAPDNCPSLYQVSDALFLPSLLECFSANYVESMVMRLPIVTTDLGFARTICSDAALYYEPLNPKQALQKILALRADDKLRKRLIQNGQVELRRFGSARARAEDYLEICSGLVRRRFNASEPGPASGTT